MSPAHRPAAQSRLVLPPPGVPAGLHVEVHEPKDGGAPEVAVVLVHGSLDRAASFRRTARRLPDLRVVTYDRRGYQGSRRAGVADLAGHIDDLVAIAAWAGDGTPVAVVGHSFGATVAVGAALAAPDRIAAVGAWEPPMRWLGFHPHRPRERLGPGDQEVHAFVERMVGEGTWDRLGERARAERLADGPALLADLAALRVEEAPFDVTGLQVPSVFGRGGPASRPHHRATVEWLAHHVPGAEMMEVPQAAHGVHLARPDAFAELVRRVAARAQETGPEPRSEVRSA